MQIFALGSLVVEAMEASDQLLKRGIYANVIVVSSQELLFGILGEQSDYRYLKDGLKVTGDLHAVANSEESAAGLLSIAGRRTPVVAVCDGEAGLLDNIGSIVGVKQHTLAVRKFSKCGRPDQVFRFQELDADSIVDAAGRVLAETAMENVHVSRRVLEAASGRPPEARRDWRQLWPDQPGE